MRKAFAILIFIMMMLSTITFLSTVESVTPAHYTWNGSLDNWTTGTGGGGSVGSSNEQYYEGNGSLKIYSPSTSSVSYAYISISADYEFAIDLKFYIVTGYRLWLFHAVVNGGTGVIQCGIDNGNKLYLILTGDTNYFNILTVTTNSWHHLQANIKNQGKTCDLIVDGEYIGTYITQNSISAGFNQIYVGDGSSAMQYGTLYLDDYYINDTLFNLPNQPPSIDSYPTIYAFSNETYLYEPTVSSYSTPTLSLETNASFLSLSSGKITGVPSLENRFKTYYVNITATNSQGSDYQNYTLYVWPNMPYLYKGISNPTPNVYNTERYLFIYWIGKGTGSYPSSRIYIGAYDYENKTWLPAVVIGDNPTDIDHGGGSICVDDLGYIHVFYGAHETSIVYKRSTYPWNITSWTTMSSPASAASYPNAYFYNNILYLVYRKTIISGNTYQYVFKTSTNHGLSWSSENVFLSLGSGYAPYLDDCIFSVENNVLKMYRTMTVHVYATGIRQNIYAFYYDFSQQKVYNMTGYDLGTSLEYSEISYCLMINTGSYHISGGGLSIRDQSHYAIFYYLTEKDTLTEYPWPEYLYMYVYNAGHVYNTLVMETLIAGNVIAGPSRVTGYWFDDRITFFAAGCGEGRIYKWHYYLANDTLLCEGAIMDDVTLEGGITLYVLRNSNIIDVSESLRHPVIITEARFIGTSYAERDYSTELRIYVLTDDGFLINWENIPEPPIEWQGPAKFTSTPPTKASVGYLYKYIITCNMTVTLQVITNASFLILEDNVLSGTPSSSDVGTFYVKIKATNEYNYSVWQNYTIVVKASDTWLLPSYDMVWTLFMIAVILIAVGFIMSIKREY